MKEQFEYSEFAMLETRANCLLLVLAFLVFCPALTNSEALAQPTINLSPRGQITSPADNELLRSIGPNTIRARFTDLDGSVVLVRFFVRSNLIGTSVMSVSNEFAITWNPGHVGNFAIHAEGLDNRGATGRTAAISVSVATNVPCFAVVELRANRLNASFFPNCINDGGEIAGSITNTPARWKNWEAELVEVFGKPGDSKAIDNGGTIVGEYIVTQPLWASPRQPFCYKPGVGVTNLPGFTTGKATGVSSAGIVGTGATNPTSSAFVGFLYSGSNYTFFSGGGSICEPRAINENGVVVGTLNTVLGERRAFMFRSSELVLLPIPLTSAEAVNRSGQITGTAGTRAYLYEDGRVTMMGELGIQHDAFDINDQGVAVGHFGEDSANGSRAFLFHNGVMIDLNQLIPPDSGWFLATARSINNKNWIVGSGSRIGSSSGKGFLLVPGPIIAITNVTSEALEGSAYLKDGTAVFEKSNDLINWVPIQTNSTGPVEVPVSLPRMGTNLPAFFRILQPKSQ